MRKEKKDCNLASQSRNTRNAPDAEELRKRMGRLFGQEQDLRVEQDVDNKLQEEVEVDKPEEEVGEMQKEHLQLHSKIQLLITLEQEHQQEKGQDS